MSLVSWLPLADYSSKYRVSVSTLRRRIKAEDIHFRFEEGKYFIFDEPVSTHQRVHRPSLSSDQALVGAPHANEEKEQAPKLQTTVLQTSKEEPILTAANKLLNELKKAYSLILQEKEEQILQLKSELADIKTLVRVLESENDRLNRIQHANNN